MLIKEIDNTFKGWCKLKEEIEGMVSQRELAKKLETLNPGIGMENDNVKIFKINVNVSCVPEQEESDIMLLQYAFPIFDVVREAGKAQGILNICIDSQYSRYQDKRIEPTNQQEKNDKEDFEAKRAQLSHFMYIQIYLRKSLRITLNDKPLSAEFARFGKINPLMSFTRQHESVFFYKHIYNVIQAPEIFTCLRRFLEFYRMDSKYEAIEKSKPYNELLRYTPFVNKNFVPESRKRYQNSQNLSLDTMWSPSGGNQEEMGIDKLYFQMFLSNITFIASKKVEGSVQNPISSEMSALLIENLLDFTERACLNIPVLAQYLWSVLIRYVFKSKKIIGGIANNRYLVQEFLDQSLQSAISYAEGLYQIIENSCFHTTTGNAYLSARIYEMDKDVEPEELTKTTKLILKFSKEFPGYTLLPEVKLYLNLVLVDNAYDSTRQQVIGMVTKYNEENPEYAVQSIRELFERKPIDRKDLLFHYGLRVLKKIIVVNQGCFKVSTPKVKNVFQAFNPEGTEQNADNVYHGTCYNILLPIDAPFTSQAEENASENTSLIDTQNILKENFVPLKIDLDIKDTIPTTQDEKDACVQFIKSQIEARVSGANRNDCIICLYMNNCRHYKIELLAKAVMSFALDAQDDCNRIAVLFDEKKYINEFVRVYSVFFDKTAKNYEKFRLSATQIALCSMRSGIPEVNFILNGNNLSTVRHTARMYAYYNSDSALEFLPVIEYLSKTEENQTKELISVFPFELYLDIESFEQPYNMSPQGIVEDKTWFFRRIEHVLNTNLQEYEYGCKISDIHVSIGSKIHIDSFYNAELLFHNYGNVCRFAYIVARELLRTHKDGNKKLCLISYESYSSLFIQKVCDIIRQYDSNFEVDYMIYSADSERMSYEQNEYFWEDLKKFADKQYQKSQLHVVLPIGTTLSTICKIQETSRIISRQHNPQCRLDFGKNIALIVVGGIDNNHGTAMGYWENVQTENKKIILNPYYATQDTSDDTILSRMVRYYFNPPCDWEDAKRKHENEENDKCLIGVDKTSTVPDVIFESLQSNKRLFCESMQTNGLNKKETNEIERRQRKNEKRINLLKKNACVRYSHIYNSGNHFQYDIDYLMLCRDGETQKELTIWLQEIRKSIDSGAFNILVSPLDIKNSVFLKMVTEIAFENCGRLLHVNINESFRETVRSKFNYIYKEFERINQMSQNIHVNVYYIDDCIVSGQTLQRGRSFIHMLLNDEAMAVNRICVYKGVIVMTNRSSYDTIQEILPGRVEKDFFYFMRLNVPLYNTYNGKCPGCDLTYQYELMHKRSSTHMIADEYLRLKQKHSLKTKVNYESYLDSKICSAKSYLLWFRRWLYYSYKMENQNYDADIKKLLDLLYTALTSEKAKKKYKNIDEVLQATVSETEYPSKKKTIIDFFKKYIVSERAFMRMYCTHEILTELEGVVHTSRSEKEAETETRRRILAVIKRRFNKIDAEQNKKDVCKLWDKAEWVISYIKVISRSQIAKYYHIRNSIYNILTELIKAIIGVSDAKEDIKFLVDFCDVRVENRYGSSVTPDMKFSIFLTAIRRLADLYSPLIIWHREHIYGFYNRCLQQYGEENDYAVYFESIGDNVNAYRQLNTIMEHHEFTFQMAKLMKWSAMSGYDGSYCFEMENKFLDNKTKDSLIDSSEILIFIENTYIIYMGVKNLVESVLGYDKKMPIDKERILQIKRIIEENYNQCPEISQHKNFFEFMKIFDKSKDNGVIYQEKYKNMCLFFAELRRIADCGGVDDPYPYEDLCNYICSIMGYDQCLIAYKEDRFAKVIVSSDLNKKYLRNNLSTEVISQIINKFDEVADSKSSNGIVQKFHLRKGENIYKELEADQTQIVVIKLPVSATDATGAYIVMYQNEIIGDLPEPAQLSMEDCWNIRNILFLRDRLEEVLNRDIATLISKISSYDYIKPLNPGEPVILHISDLHVSLDNKEDMINAIQENEKNVQDKSLALKNINPDLILITGDVAQASYSAPSLVKNYEAAEEVIKEIVSIVWGFSGKEKERDIRLSEMEFIRNDWKKRVLISTGNHDYASMNELEAKNKARMTLSGVPGENIGSTMIKYSYFINFLHNLLGIDIDRATRYDLNDIIQYHHLKLSVFNINSGSGVNPYRTNKVQINTQAVKELNMMETKKYRSIHMMHHTPIYSINYINDIYYMDRSFLVKLYEDIQKNLDLPKIDNISEMWLSMIANSMTGFEKTLEGINGEIQEKILLALIEGIKKKDLRTYIDKNLSDLKHYLNIRRQKRNTDDRCSQVMSALREKEEMSRNDNQAYAVSVKDYLSEVGEEFYILGGHEHYECKYSGNCVGVLSKCRGIFEAGKFFSKTEKKLHYSVLEFGGDYNFVNESGDIGKIFGNDTIKEILREEKDSNKQNP